MALDTQDKRLAVVSLNQAYNLSLPVPDNVLSGGDRAQILGLSRDITVEAVTLADRLALLQFNVIPAVTLPSPDGELDSDDRRHLLMTTRFESDVIFLPKVDLAFSSQAPTLASRNSELFLTQTNLVLSSRAPTLTPNWVSNNWWNPFWTLPLADFNYRQGDWWGPSDTVETLEVDSTNLAITSFEPTLFLEQSLELFLPYADAAISSEAPSLLIGSHIIYPVPQADAAISSEAPDVYVEGASELVLPSGAVDFSSQAPVVSYYPAYHMNPPMRDLSISSSAPVLLTQLAGLDLPSAAITLSSDAPTPFITSFPISREVAPGEVTAGGRYGRPYAVFPQKKKRKLPEGPGIAAVQMGDNVLVSRSPKVGLTSPPLSSTEAARMMRDLNRNLEQTGKTFTAEIKSFREALEAREAAKERKAKEQELRTLKKQKEALEQEIEKNQEMMAAILLLMVE